MKTKRNALRPRVSRRQCEQVIRLLADDWSDSEVARATGLLRATVARIRRGFRPKRDNEPELFGPVSRCAGCGKLVTSPCVYCSAIRYLETTGGAA